MHPLAKFFFKFLVSHKMDDDTKNWAKEVNIGQVRSNQGSMESQRADLSCDVAKFGITLQ